MNRSISDPQSGASPNLASAVRRARLEEAERSDAIGGIRSAEAGRLELLLDAIRPILAQVPQHIDMFDAGVTRGDHPRLFIDMIGFIEIDRDGRTYRLVQDTRHGRLVIAEVEGLEAALEEVSSYIARRLVEREKALAADTTLEAAARRLSTAGQAALQLSAARRSVGADAADPPTPVATPPRRRRGIRHAVAVLRFVVEFLGTVALLLVLMGAGFWLTHALKG